MPQQEKGESGLKGLTSTLGRSAEYSIALGLIVVCLVVGGALWFLDSGPAGNTEATTAEPDRDNSSIAEEERKALESYQQKLQGNFKEIEEQQRRIAEESAQRERQRQDAERAAEAERQRAKAAAAAATPLSTAAPAAATAAPPRPVATTAPVRRAAVRVDPAIDWSSCRRPEYPESSVRRKEQGTVAVDVEVDAGGKALSSRIATSSGHTKLDTVTQRAIERCRFSPATVDGKPEASTATVRFTWQLN